MPLLTPTSAVILERDYECRDMEPEQTGYHIGLDLGQARDFSALCIDRKDTVQRYVRGTTRLVRTITHHNVVRLHRWPLGTSYPEIARSVARAIEQLPVLSKPPVLIIDAGGVGRAVADNMRELGLNFRACTITGGTEVSGSYENVRIAKKVLASTLDAIISDRRLHVADSDPLAQALLSELENFTIKTTSTGSETMSALRERDHDDLCIACALACWSAQQSSSHAVQRLGY